MGGIDELMANYSDPTEALARCDNTGDYSTKTKRLTAGLRLECEKEINQVANCLARLEEEAAERNQKKSKIEVLSRSLFSNRRGDFAQSFSRSLSF